MSGKKISELDEASLPLSGSEDVPLVQGGNTVRAPASAFGGNGGFKLACGRVAADGTLVTPGSLGIDHVEALGSGSYDVFFETGYFDGMELTASMTLDGNNAGLTAVSSLDPTLKASLRTKNTGGGGQDFDFCFIIIGVPV